MTTRAAAVALLIIVAAGCSSEARSEFDVGAHHVSAVVPHGWEHVDQGKRHVLRRPGTDGVILEDFGPVDPRGIAREVERARALWRHGKDGEARTVLTMVPFPEEPRFATAEDRHAFWGAWSDVANASNETDLATIEPRFDRLLERVAALPERSSAEAIAQALKTAGEDARRDVASRSRREVNGNSWDIIETWNRLSHDDRRPFAILVDGGCALVVRMESWSPPRQRDDLFRVLRSLRVRPAA